MGGQTALGTKISPNRFIALRMEYIVILHWRSLDVISAWCPIVEYIRVQCTLQFEGVESERCGNVPIRVQERGKRVKLQPLSFLFLRHKGIIYEAHPGHTLVTSLSLMDCLMYPKKVC